MLKQLLSGSPQRVCCWHVAIPLQSHESIRSSGGAGGSVWHIMYFRLHNHLSCCFHFMKCFYRWSASAAWVFSLVSSGSLPNEGIWEGSASALSRGGPALPGRVPNRCYNAGLPLRSSASSFLSPWLMRFPRFTASSSSPGTAAEPAWSPGQVLSPAQHPPAPKRSSATTKNK